MTYLLFCDCPNGHNIAAASCELAAGSLQTVADKFVFLTPPDGASECPACGAPRSEWLYYAQPSPAPAGLRLEDVQAHFPAPAVKRRIN